MEGVSLDDLKDHGQNRRLPPTRDQWNTDTFTSDKLGQNSANGH